MLESKIDSVENQYNFEKLSIEEMVEIDGGGFWGDLAYGIAATARVIVEIRNSMASDPRFGDANYYK